MDSVTLVAKIKELGHVNSKREELRDFCKSHIDQILKYVPSKIVNSDGADLLDCIFNGLSDQTPQSKTKVKIVDIVLKVMRKESTSLTHCSDVISRLCLELPRMPPNDLVRWSNDTLQSIVDDSDVNMIWKDILPECQSALSIQNKIKHCGTDMTPEEYKEQCVRTLCQCRWSERQLVQLAAMFKYMQLNRDDHKQVVNKICSYVIDIPPETLPPLFHQLLKLCKSYDVEIVLAYFSHYFNMRLYTKLEPSQNDSESTTMEIDDIVPYSEAELSRCLSTCIYHISQGAADPEIIRKHLKQWPKTQLLKNPFLLDLALALSDKGPDFRTICLDVIKQAIEQRIQDEQKKKESAWVRSVLPPDVDVASVLKVLTTESVSHRQLTALGLLRLGAALVGNKHKCRTLSSMGQLLLVRLSKAQPETAPKLLQHLADCLRADAVYADCLYVLCKLTPLSIQRCTQLSTIVESCAPTGVDYHSAAAVLEATHPLLNLSTRLRDTLIMVCRKRLYSRDSLHRCLALSGFLCALRYVTLPRGAAGGVGREGGNGGASSSDQLSAHQYLTQLSAPLTNTCTVTSRVRNEAMLMEVVSIMRRCLLQDAAVKQLLYSKIYECAKEKPILHESILEMLYEHLTKYLSEDDSGLTFDKCVQTHAITAVLTEPIAYLLYGIAQFLQPIEDEDLEDILGSQGGETGSAYLRSKLQSVLEKLCSSQRFGNIDLDDPGLSDLTPESKAKSLQVQQILQCYEALIAHQVMQWNRESQTVASDVCGLFKSYNDLLDKTKAPSKLSKKSSKSTLNDTKETNKTTQKSQKSQKEKGKAPIKLSNLVKDRAGPFKPLPCLWNLNFCLRIVQLLYSEEVLWSSLEQRNQIRSRRDFHQFVLQCVQAVLTNEHLEKRAVATYVVQIAEVLYKRCICRFEELCDFDEQTALGCLDVFRDCLNLLLSPNFNFKIEKFLPNITTLQDSTGSESIAAILSRFYMALEQCDAAEQSNKTTAALTQACVLLLNVPAVQDTRLDTVIIQLEDFVRRCKINCLQLIPSLLTANCRGQLEATFLDDLLVKLLSALGRIDEEDTSAGQETENFPSIDERTGQTVLNYVCAHLMNRFKHIEHLVMRLKDLQTALKCSTQANCLKIDKEIGEVSSSIVSQLCLTGEWSSRLCQTRGSGDKPVALCVRLYSLACAACKHIPLPNTRIERLLKICGKKLSSITDNLITYLEASQPQQQPASKVLRETKLIPRLVLEAEQFHRLLILLSKKHKMNWQQYLSLGTARDFRIKAPVLQEMLQARDRGDALDNEDVEIHDAETTILSEHRENVEDRVRTKRRRVS